MIWYYAHEGKRIGPVDEAEFEALVETRVITADTLVWNETLPKWLHYAEIGQGAGVGQQTSQSSSSQIFFRDAASQRTTRCYECGKSFSRDNMIRYKDTWVCASCKPIFVQRLKEGVLSQEMRKSVEQLASRWKRLGGALIDGLVALIITLPIMIWGGVFSQITAGQQFSLGQQAGFFILGNLVFLALHGYLLAKHGQTIGKKVVGTRIVGLDGQHIPFGKMYFVRYFLPSLIAQLPFLGGIFGLVDALFVFRNDKRCIHDLMAGTQVVDV